MPRSGPSADVKRKYAECVAGAENAAGGARAFQIIGSTYRRALVAEQIVRLCYVQDDEHVTDSAVRRLLSSLWDIASQDDHLTGGC